MLLTENVLGEAPPRADFIVLVEEEENQLRRKAGFFQTFRRFNIIEYKRPSDSLNERVLRKAVGYANFYISMAEHEGDILSNQVTISIFRSVKNPKMFTEMTRNGSLSADEMNGIYHVHGYTDLPFQIVITSELEGEKYAIYRALTDKAKEEDIEYLINIASKETEFAKVRHYGVLLQLISNKIRI